MREVTKKEFEQKILDLEESYYALLLSKQSGDRLHIKHKEYLIDLLIKTGNYNSEWIYDKINEINREFYEEEWVES